MDSITGIIRPEVLKIEPYPYATSKPLSQIMKEKKLKKMIYLGSNENSLGPSPRAIEVLRRGASGVYRYPDGGSAALRQALAKKHKAGVDEIIIGAGSDEIIELIAKTFIVPGDKIIVSRHAFVRYKAAGDLMGAGTIVVPCRGFGHDLEQMAAKVSDKVKIVFIANPNNPTGTYNNVREVDGFLRKLPGRVIAVFDQAYFEYSRSYADYPDTSGYFRKYNNVITLRTFSKLYALAGLRVGYAITSKSIISALNKVRQPFNVSAPAQAAAAASLKDTSHIRRSVKAVEAGKKYLYGKFRQLGVDYIESAGNFILFGARPFTGRILARRLLDMGVIVRSLDDYELPLHIRVTVGTVRENDTFVKALEKILSKD